MKVSDILTEEITMSIETSRVQQIIEYAIDRCMQFTYKCIVQDINKPTSKIKNHRTLAQVVLTYLNDELPLAVKRGLINVYCQSPYDVNNIQFVKQLGSEGLCRYTSIEIDHYTLDVIIQILTESVLDAYGNIVFREDGTVDIAALQDVFQNYKHFQYLEQLIFKIVNIFIHELVHVQQQKKQTKRLVDTGSTEYRSYLTKNQKEFNVALRNLTDEYNYKIYNASPQEIPAFAHNLALSLIQVATRNKPIQTVQDIDELKYLIGNLKDMIQDPDTYKYNTYFKDYEKFNDNTNQLHYKVFKRFMKLVYREVYNYTQHIQTRINNLTKDPNYDINQMLNN